MLHIRPIQTEDAEIVALLARQLGYERTPQQITGWLNALDERTQAAFVASLEKEVVGWIEVALVHHLQSDPFTLIGGLVVRDGTRGHGIGRLLCERAETWSCEKGVATVRVTSRSTRLAAHRFYLRDGYHLDKTSHVFEKSLPKASE